MIKRYNSKNYFTRCNFCVIAINVLRCFIDKTFLKVVSFSVAWARLTTILQVIVIVNVQQLPVFSFAIHLIFFLQTHIRAYSHISRLMAFLGVCRDDHMQVHFFPIQRRGHACKIEIETLKGGFVPTFLRTYIICARPLTATIVQGWCLRRINRHLVRE